MACPQQRNIDTKRLEKLTKYYNYIAFEERERRPGYVIVVVPLIIGALGGGMRQITKDMAKVFENGELLKRIVGEMQKTVLMDSETILRKVLSGLVQ